MKRAVHALTVATGIIALVLAACGGAAEPTATPPPAPTTAAPTPTPPPAATATPIAVASPTPAAVRPTVTPVLIPPTLTPTPVGVQPKSGGVLRNRTLYDLANWDSWDAFGSVVAGGTFANAFSSLVVFDLDKPSVILPDLAERWQQSADGKTLQFFIRKDVKWHDGKQLTARDVAWNLERGWKGEGTVTYNKGRFREVAGIETPDDYTVTVKFKQPSASFLANMSVVYLLIYAPHGVPPNSQEMKEKGKAIGSGPFKVSGYTSDVKYEFVRNDNYYKKDEAGRPLPYLNGITSWIIVDAFSAQAAFRARRLDCGCNWDLDFLTANYDVIKRDLPGVSLTIGNTAIVPLVFNQREPWTDPRVRKAVMAAMDRLQIRKLYRGGRGYYPPNVFLSPELGGSWGLPSSELLQRPGFRVKDGKKDPADLELARQLFKEAGIDPTKVTVTYAGFSGSTADAHEVMAAVLSESTGMKVELNRDVGVAARQRLLQGNFDVFPVYGANSFDDPSDQAPRFALTAGPENYGKWQRPELDALFVRMDRELDFAKRQQLAYEWQRKLLDEAVASPVKYIVAAWGTHPGVLGFKGGPFTTTIHMRLERMWFDESAR